MISDLFTHNRWQKVFSLLFASLIWCAVHWGIGFNPSGSGPGPEFRTFDSQPVTVLTAPSTLGRYEVSPARVGVVLRGQAAALAKVKPTDLEVYVNLVETAQTRMLRPIHVHAPPNTELVSVNPAVVQIERQPGPGLPLPH